jgi:feruloyl esterase
MLQVPPDCEFDPAELACDNRRSECLAPAALDAIATVYGGPSAGSQPIFFGFPFGAEDIDDNGWGSWLTGGAGEGVATPSAAWAFGMGVMRYFATHDPGWSYLGYDPADYAADLKAVSATVNANDADLHAFRARGGKLLMFHGWADVALSAHMSTDYVDRVYEIDPEAREDVRLFMMPGVLHCAGGPGPSVVDWLDELARWHDSRVPPGELIASWPDRPGARKLCAWPQHARFTGGEPDQPQSWRCD